MSGTQPASERAAQRVEHSGVPFRGTAGPDQSLRSGGTCQIPTNFSAFYSFHTFASVLRHVSLGKIIYVWVILLIINCILKKRIFIW